MPARVLIIEDNAANLELMRYLLAAFGHHPSVASSGEAAIEATRLHRPDLILCDIQLPGIDGYEVVRLLRAQPDLPRVPVIAVTALAMAGDRDKALSAGFDGYLSKPIDPETFVPQVEGYLNASLRHVPAVRGNEVQAASMASVASRRTILAVDNLQVNLDLAASLFESFGYKVVAAQDHHQALRLARQDPPDLILSDVCMPNGSGYDLIAAVKSDPRLKSIPFVFITSTVTNEDARQKGMALGATKFLFRPIEPLALLGEIEACLPGEAQP